MENKKLTISVSGKVNTGKSRLILLLKKFLQENNFKVEFDGGIDYTNEANFDEVVGENLEQVIETIKETSVITMKEVQEQEERYDEKELKLWLAHRDVYLYNYYTTYVKSGIPMQSVEDFIKESHEYLMDRK